MIFAMKTRKSLPYKRHMVHGRVRFVVSFSENGKRARRHFETAPEAEVFAEKIKTLKENQGAAAFSLSDKLRVEALECEKRLAAVGASLTKATEFFLQYAVPAGGRRSICNFRTIW